METLAHSSPKNLVPISIQITERDIAEMEYHFNECPMSHPALHNAVTTALKRKIKSEFSVAVHIGRNGAEAEIGPWSCPLGDDIGSWLGRMLTGCRVRPAKFRIVVPAAAVKSALDTRPHAPTLQISEPSKMAMAEA